MWGAILGGLAAGLASGAAGAVGDRWLQSSGNDYNVHNYKHRYQWQVEDMRQAGLNPILAASASPGSVPSAPSGGSGLASGVSQFGNALGNAVKQYVGNEVELSRAQTTNVKADTRAKEAQVANIEAQTRLSLAQAAKTSAMTPDSEMQQRVFAARAAQEYLRTEGLATDNQLKSIRSWTDAAEARLMYGFEPRTAGFYDSRTAGFDSRASAAGYDRPDRDDYLDAKRALRRLDPSDPKAIHWYMRQYKVDFSTASQMIRSVRGFFSLGK